MKTILSLGLFSLAAAFTACACSASHDPSASPTASVAQAAEPAANLHGTWAFVLDASDVAAPIRETCAKKAPGDAAKADACWREVSSEAAREKVRFAKDGAGRDVWTSFGVEEGREEIFLEVPVELTPDGRGHVLAKIAGKPRGGMAAQLEPITVMRIEVVDARTIAMIDPKKGRLVYTKE